MNSTLSSSAREVPVDILPPGPGEPVRPITEAGARRVPFEGLNTFYHPASGVAILGLDWILFGSDMLTGFLAFIPMCILGFLASFLSVFWIQRNWARDTSARAAAKAFFGAVMVALPFPVTGTLLGAGILALSGLPHHPVEAVRRLVFRGSAK